MSLTKFNPRVGKETIKTVDSTSDVRANKDFSNPMLVLGGEILGDGKGGVYHWDANSNAIDDDVSVIKSNHSPTGRWLVSSDTRLLGLIDVMGRLDARIRELEDNLPNPKYHLELVPSQTEYLEGTTVTVRLTTEDVPYGTTLRYKVTDGNGEINIASILEEPEDSFVMLGTQHDLSFTIRDDDDLESLEIIKVEILSAQSEPLDPDGNDSNGGDIGEGFTQVPPTSITINVIDNTAISIIKVSEPAIIQGGTAIFKLSVTELPDGNYPFTIIASNTTEVTANAANFAISNGISSEIEVTIADEYILTGTTLTLDVTGKNVSATYDIFPSDWKTIGNVPTNNPSDKHESSIELSGDGNTLLISSDTSFYHYNTSYATGITQAYRWNNDLRVWELLGQPIITRTPSSMSRKACLSENGNLIATCEQYGYYNTAVNPREFSVGIYELNNQAEVQLTAAITGQTYMLAYGYTINNPPTLTASRLALLNNSLSIDLGRTQNVSGVTAVATNYANISTYASGWMKEYAIEYSLDNTNWLPVEAEQDTYVVPLENQNTNQDIEYSFPSITARYIRLRVIDLHLELGQLANFYFFGTRFAAIGLDTTWVKKDAITTPITKSMFMDMDLSDDGSIIALKCYRDENQALLGDNISTNISTASGQYYNRGSTLVYKDDGVGNYEPLGFPICNPYTPTAVHSHYAWQLRRLSNHPTSCQLSGDGLTLAISVPDEAITIDAWDLDEYSPAKYFPVRVYKYREYTEADLDVSFQILDFGGGTRTLSSTSHIRVISGEQPLGKSSVPALEGPQPVTGNHYWIQEGADIRSPAVRPTSGPRPDTWIEDIENFGQCISLSKDGNRIAISAPGNLANAYTYEFGSVDTTYTGPAPAGLNTPNKIGECYIYDWNSTSGNWEQSGETIRGSSISEQFGANIDLSGDGNLLLVGVPHATHEDGTEYSGCIRSYRQGVSGENWYNIGDPTFIDNQTSNQLGVLNSVSDDGTRVATLLYRNDLPIANQVNWSTNNYVRIWSTVGDAVDQLLTAIFELDQTSFSLNGQATPPNTFAGTITGSSNTSWTATALDSWINLETTTGIGSISVPFSVESGDEGPRTGRISIRSNNQLFDDTTVVVQVFQEAYTELLEVDLHSLTKLSAEENAPYPFFDVTSNSGWEIEGPSWLSYLSSSGASISTTGSGNGSIWISAEDWYDTLNDRTGTITVTGDEGTVVTKTFTQERFRVAVAWANDGGLDGDPYGDTVTGDEGSYSRVVNSRSDFTVESRDSWITLTGAQGGVQGSPIGTNTFITNIDYDVAENPSTSASRTGTILISVPEGSLWLTGDPGDTAPSTRVLTITQEPRIDSAFLSTESFKLKIDTSLHENQSARTFEIRNARNALINWGDGSAEEEIGSTVVTSTTHTYTTAAARTVYIKQTVPNGPTAAGSIGFSFDGAGNECVKEVSSWGTMKRTDLNNFMEGCSNLTILPTIPESFDTSEMLQMQLAFKGCSSLTEFPSGLDTSAVGAMQYAFYGCSSLTEFPVQDYTNVSLMGFAWTDCSSLTSFPTLTTTGNVISMARAWSRCTNLEVFNPINITKIQSLQSAWSQCDNLDIFSSVLIQAITDSTTLSNIDEAWSGCSSLPTSVFADFDVPAEVTSLDQTWQGCTGLTGVFPLINTSNVTNMNRTWQACSGLTGVFPLINTSNVNSMDNTWQYCSGLTGVFPLIDTSNVNSMDNTWNGCLGLTSFPSGLDTSNVTNMNSTWKGCLGLTSFPSINCGASTRMEMTWLDCTSLANFGEFLNISWQPARWFRCFESTAITCTRSDNPFKRGDTTFATMPLVSPVEESWPAGLYADFSRVFHLVPTANVTYLPRFDISNATTARPFGHRGDNPLLYNLSDGSDVIGWDGITFAAVNPYEGGGFEWDGTSTNPYEINMPTIPTDDYDSIIIDLYNNRNNHTPLEEGKNYEANFGGSVSSNVSEAEKLVLVNNGWIFTDGNT